jgi:hypothetical protein
VGERALVLVGGPSRRGGRQLSGRDAYHRVVNFEAPGEGGPRPGTLVDLHLVEATPHSLIGEIPDPAGARVRRSVKPAAAKADEWVRIGGIPS